MAIVKVLPEQHEEADRVSVDSDADNNARAVVEIDEWAANHDFVRVNEYWLEQINRDGKRLFRGTCYRCTEEERHEAAAARRRTDALMKQMRVTKHAVE